MSRRYLGVDIGGGNGAGLLGDLPGQPLTEFVHPLRTFHCNGTIPDHRYCKGRFPGGERLCYCPCHFPEGPGCDWECTHFSTNKTPDGKQAHKPKPSSVNRQTNLGLRHRGFLDAGKGKTK